MLSQGVFINITQIVPAHLTLEEARTRRGCGILPRDTQLSPTEPRLRPTYLRVSQKAEDSGHGRTQSPELAEQVPRATTLSRDFSELVRQPPKPSSLNILRSGLLLTIQQSPGSLARSLLCLTNRLLTSSDPKAIGNKQEHAALGSHVNRCVSPPPFPEP